MHLPDLVTYPAATATTVPCLLDGRSAGHLVDGGMADLFAVRVTPDGAMSRRHPVARLPAGSIMPSPTVAGPWRLLVAPLPGTTLRGISADGLRALHATARRHPQNPTTLAFARSVDLAIRAINTALQQGQPPRGTTRTTAIRPMILTAGEALATDGSVAWLSTLTGLLRREAPDCPGPAHADELITLAGRDWVVAETDCAVQLRSSHDLLTSGRLGAELDAYVGRLLRVLDRRISQAESSHLARIEQRKVANAAMLGSAARQSLRVLGVGAGQVRAAAPSMVELDPIGRAAAVLRVVTGHDRDLVREPIDRELNPRDDRDAVLAVARSSALHTREVALPADWLRRDVGPLVVWQPIGDVPVFDRTAERPVRALPVVFRRGRYHRVDPETLACTPLRGPAAEDLGEQALTVQLPMPEHGGRRALLRTGLRGVRRDLSGVLFAAALVATLGLATPLVTGAVLGQVAASGQAAQLIDVSLLFLGSALLAAMVGVIRNLLFLRLEGRAERDTQILVWDRLMRLPVRFFTTLSSGELASIVLGVTFIREALGGLLAQALSAVLMSVMVVVLLVSVDVAVAGVAVGVIMVTVAGTAVLGRVVVRRQRQALPAEHRLSALTNQMIGGIAKVKLAAAEDRAYARWATMNSTAEQAARRVRSVQSLLAAASTALPTAAQLLLLALLTGPLAGRLRPADFFLVNSAFLLLIGMLLVLVNAGVAALVMLPRIEDLSLVADTEPEQHTDRVDPGELGGEIQLVDVDFGYAPETPPVLQGLSLRIEPGQFVAIVGPSGSGKSTLLRLLLGFDQPDTGSVLYDGQDLSELDTAAVRRQCGVVLQNGQLFAGTLRENIAGAGSYPLERLWDAARIAGIDSDIADLPMGMSTMIPFGGGTLSVGQRQRLLIARALVGRPRILFFDEATSALDNRTQDIVSTGLNALAVTRVVIAHRISTVADADVIIVLDRGRVVQTGRYDDLMADEAGPFAQLARRQLLAAD